MKITNQHNLPQPVYDAVVQSLGEYDNGGADYSATDLIKPVRIVLLQQRHKDEIEVDAMDLMWAFWGNLGHLALSTYSKSGIPEKRLAVELLDRSISGQADHWQNGVLLDYKFTKIKSTTHASRLGEWNQQLNIYKYIFNKHGYEVKYAKIIAFLKDWDAAVARVTKNYPQYPVMQVPILLRYVHETRAEMIGAISRLKVGETLADDQLPPCTPEERWQRGRVFVVTRDGRKRAVRIFSEEKMAYEYVMQNQEKCNFELDYEERRGVNIRCEYYCLVRPFCNAHDTEPEPHDEGT